MKIYLIRHGQTTGDVEDRYGGDYDDDLTNKGRNQAKKLSLKLKDSGIQIIFCSPLSRAKQTAEILKETLNCGVKVVQDFRERNKNGILTGLAKSEAKLKFPELVEKLKDYRNQIDGAESQEDFGERVKKVFVLATSDPSYSTVGIVTHGGVIWAIFTDILKNNNLAHIGDTAYLVLNKKGDNISIEKMDGIEYKTG